MKEFTLFEKLLSYLENLDDYNYPSNSLPVFEIRQQIFFTMAHFLTLQHNDAKERFEE